MRRGCRKKIFKLSRVCQDRWDLEKSHHHQTIWKKVPIQLKRKEQKLSALILEVFIPIVKYWRRIKVVASTLLLWLHSVFVYFFSWPDSAVQPSQGSRIFIFFTDLVQGLRLFYLSEICCVVYFESMTKHIFCVAIINPIMLEIFWFSSEPFITARYV